MVITMEKSKQVVISRDEYESSFNDFIMKELFAKRINRTKDYIKQTQNSGYVDINATLNKILEILEGIDTK